MYHYRILGKSLNITDGDSFRADIDLGFRIWHFAQAFRLYGVDAPEMHTTTLEAGRAAKAEFVRLMSGHEWLYVRTSKDSKDKYGRWLALVFTDPNVTDEAESINQQLLRGGFGYVPMIF